MTGFVGFVESSKTRCVDGNKKPLFFQTTFRGGSQLSSIASLRNG